MSHVEQLERETEQTRTRIADTLDELRASITPGRVLDQLADRVSDGAPAAFARNLRDQAVNNPLSVALIGAGLAWLMLGPHGSNGSFRRRTEAQLRNAADKGSGALSEKDTEWGEQAERFGKDSTEGLSSAAERTAEGGADAASAFRDTVGSLSGAAQRGASQAADSAREAAGSIADSARQKANRAGDAVRDSAGSMSDSIQRTASAGYEAIADTARKTAGTFSDSTRSAGQRTLRSGSAFLDFCRDQPMVLAGLGLAAGAVMGALLPSSETEDHLMGGASDRVKTRAQDLASEQYEHAKKVGERALSSAEDEAIKHVNEQEKAGDRKDERERPAAAEAKSDTATLVPSDESELERRGQPWTSGNAPV